MWFHYFLTFCVIVFLLYFAYETIRKMFFPTEEEQFDASASSEQLQQKIQELKNLKTHLQTVQQEVEVTEQLKDVEKEIEKYRKMLSELESE